MIDVAYHHICWTRRPSLMSRQLQRPSRAPLSNKKVTFSPQQSYFFLPTKLLFFKKKVTFFCKKKYFFLPKKSTLRHMHLTTLFLIYDPREWHQNWESDLKQIHKIFDRQISPPPAVCFDFPQPEISGYFYFAPNVSSLRMCTEN